MIKPGRGCRSKKVVEIVLCKAALDIMRLMLPVLPSSIDKLLLGVLQPNFSPFRDRRGERVLDLPQSALFS